MPNNNNKVVDFAYGFESNENCTNVVQKGFIRTSVCARNFVAYGDVRSVDDSIMFECDASNSYILYHNDIDCQELLFVQMYNTGLQNFLQTEICAEISILNRNIIFKCIDKFPPVYEHTKRGGYFDENTMSERYSTIEYYRKSRNDFLKTQKQLKSDGWRCDGDPIVIIPSKNGVCSGNQMTFANESIYIIHVYDVK